MSADTDIRPEPYKVSGERQILAEFLVEASDHISAVEMLVLGHSDGYSKEVLNAIFRAVHSIKGGSSYFNLREISAISHGVEKILDKTRNHQIDFDQNVSEIVFSYIDLLRKLISRAKSAMQNDGTIIPHEGFPVLKAIVDSFNAGEAGMPSNSAEPSKSR